MEQVVLVNEWGIPIGFADKLEVHNQDTPLHLAFSCYLLNDAGEILVSRRSLNKKTWPGVWTNSFCGHPGKEESFAEAIKRRASEELGAGISSLEIAVPDFRYRAVDANGIVENEICPVFIAQISGEISANPSEVSEWIWVDRTSLKLALESTPFAFSPWMVLQMPQLDAMLTMREEAVETS